MPAPKYDPALAHFHGTVSKPASIDWKPVMSAAAWLKLPEAKRLGKRQAFHARGVRGEYHVEPVVHEGKVMWTATCRAPGETTADDVGTRSRFSSSIAAMRAAAKYDAVKPAMPVKPTRGSPRRASR